MSGGLEVYHLGLSQSERILWLLEELGLPYTLHLFERDPQTGLAPQALKDANPTGTAPYFVDNSVSPPVALFESGAIVEYILAVHSARAPGPRLIRTPADKDYAAYVNFLHFANATVQANVSRNMTLLFADQAEGPIGQRYAERLSGVVAILDKQLSMNKWLAGDELSAADIMTVFSVTTMRGFYPLLDLTEHKNVLRWLKDVEDRPAYREALRKGDKGMRPMTKPKEGPFLQFAAFGSKLKKYA